MTDFDTFIQQFAYKPVLRGGGVVNAIVKMEPRGKSAGEKLINRILESWGYRYGIDYIMEHTFPELGRLRFDFFIRGIRAVIEMDGDQHYRGSKFVSTRKEWTDAIARDEEKNEFCKKRGISLIRIPQAYVKQPRKLETLLKTFIEKVSLGEPVYELDLYFQISSGKIIL
jgi:hypothetical protein